MIQRIQSLFLLVVCILNFMMLFLPQAIFVDESGNIYQLIYKGIVKDSQTGIILAKQYVFYTIIIFLSIVMSAICIFLFKNRTTQIKACWILISLLVLLSGYEIYIYKTAHLSTILFKSNLTMSSLIPVISLILTYLAILSIKKDKRLVKSIDRIR